MYIILFRYIKKHYEKIECENVHCHSWTMCTKLNPHVETMLSAIYEMLTER